MIRVIGFVFEIVFEVLSAIISGLFEFISALFDQERKTEFDAVFFPPHEIMRKQDKGFCLTGEYCLSISESYKNAIALGGSGSGKSSTILINSALLMAKGNSSLIFNDPSHEIRLLVSGALIELGYEIRVINYNSLNSECFNPLKRCQTISDIQKLASLLVRNALGDSKDPFWNKSAEAIISLFIRYLIFYAEPEFRTLYNVLHLINVFAGNPEKMDRLIVIAKDEKMLSEYKAFVAYGDKTLSSILATAKASLTLFTDETVASITSIDTIDFSEFRTKKVALFINNSVPDMHYYSALSSLFFQQFFNELLVRIPTKNETNIFFLLDEASSMYLPGLSTTISNIRKYNSGILLIYQDYHQLEHVYGSYEAKNITANCYAKVYLPGQPIETCKILETTLGKFEYEDENEVRHIRQLMTADEIRMSDRAIVLIGNKPPIHAKLRPYYNDWKLNSLTMLPPYEPSNNLPFDIPPLIHLDEKKKA
ncbi:MAG: type IV secretory system conjugative DNA transfer family protein [Saprospiraceae bacterium]|nr:type IV secretory system conjugative DNA transfer family protein [Candidatus Vicinibacter affinis]